MRPRLDVVTLAVADLERARQFYAAVFGVEGRVAGTQWVDEESGANGTIALFELEGGLMLSLYPREDLAKDAAIEPEPPANGGFSLGHLAESNAEVDELLRAAGAAGAETTPARQRPWGIYSGYFRDPDGHLWEVISSPRREA